jgi:hypothetical protein
VPAPILFAPDVSPPPSQRAAFGAWSEGASVIDSYNLKERLPADANVYGMLPGRETLLELKWFAEQTGSPTALYACETFGGCTEYEWCWEFGSRERVLVSAGYSESTQVVERGWLGRRHIRTSTRIRSRVHELTAVDLRQVADETNGGVLPLMLEAFGLRTSGYFRPHTREFDWTPYRVSPGSG